MVGRDNMIVPTCTEGTDYLSNAFLAYNKRYPICQTTL